MSISIAYLQAQLVGAILLGFPGIFAPLFFRSSRLASVLSGIIAALIMPTAAVHYDLLPGEAADHGVLLVMTVLLGGVFGLFHYAIIGRR